MPRFEYAGPGPVPDGEGSVVRPSEVREMDDVPSWGPWFGLDGDGRRIAVHESTGVQYELDPPPGSPGPEAAAEPSPPARPSPTASKTA